MSKCVCDFDCDWYRVNAFSRCVTLTCILLPQIISYSDTKVLVLVMKCKHVDVYELIFLLYTLGFILQGQQSIAAIVCLLKVAWPVFLLVLKVTFHLRLNKPLTSWKCTCSWKDQWLRPCCRSNKILRNGSFGPQAFISEESESSHWGLLSLTAPTPSDLLLSKLLNRSLEAYCKTFLMLSLRVPGKLYNAPQGKTYHNKGLGH